MNLKREECFEIISTGDKEDIIKIGKTIEKKHNITVVRLENILLPIKALDVKNVEFCLGDVFATECKVSVDGSEGYMLVIGDDKDKAYYGAIIDGSFELLSESEKKWLFDELIKIKHKSMRKIAEKMAKISDTKVEYEIID